MTRGAAEALSERAALLAARAAADEARRPEHVARARDNARAALGSLLSAPLVAAGVTVRRVVVTFPGERRATDKGWDVSRAVRDVVGR